ncbi:MAG: class I SAM-dependent methyltransferase [Acidimicrobiia bacterium]|nr:class I SAM-dependent methyltransferase [Acidimicrobiia bacterium]
MADNKLEAAFFDQHDNQLTRSVAWSAIPFFQSRLHQRLDLVATATAHLERTEDLRALTLGCGDMTGEYGLLRRFPVTQIVAYDLSEGQRANFYERTYDESAGIDVDYRIGDAAADTLGSEEFDLVYIQQSFHHFEEVEKVAANIRMALRPGGVFLLNDYIGTPFLQRSERQRAATRRIWRHLPARLRTGANGEVWDDILIPPIENLPPHEAVRSDAILPALRENFDIIDEHQFAGLLFPLFNGFAQNYTEADMTFVRSMWEVDEWMIAEGAIEPNFIRGLYRAKA